MSQKIAAGAVSFIVIVVILAWYSFWLVEPINLATADLGRHIQNGRNIIAPDATSNMTGVLKTNFYSYTHTDFPFVNHHWGTGVIFYLATQLIGFAGLHIVFIALSLLTLLTIFDLARRLSSTFVAAAVTIPLVPLLGSRSEIRPEVFSYLFIAMFLWLLWQHQRGKIHQAWLWLLPLMQVVWVNLHVYFLFGPALIVAFILPWLGKILWTGQQGWQQAGDKIRNMSLVLLAVVAASIISPHHFRSLWQVTAFFQNYGYKIVENQSIQFLENWGMVNPAFLIVKVAIVATAASLALPLMTLRRLPAAPLAVWLVVAGMAALAIRNFTLFGFITIPLLAYNFRHMPLPAMTIPKANQQLIRVLTLVVIAAGTYFYNFDAIARQQRNLAAGLIPDINQAAQFIKDNNLNGPIFNNYDIGGYLIYHFYPDEKVFVDNRPEAYPASFFEEIYIPMQQDDQVWQQQLDAHNFNLIVFWRHDLTDWAQNFLAARINDRNWATVYIDPYIIVFIKENAANQEIISAHRIPASAFGSQSR